MISNPIYKYLAILAVIAGVLTAAYVKGYSDADRRSEIAGLRNELEVQRLLAENERNARAVDEINAVAAQARLDILERKAKDLYSYADTLEDGDAVCLDGTDTERLRDLWDHPPVVPGAPD
jgi:hypothetical protein